MHQIPGTKCTAVFTAIIGYPSLLSDTSVLLENTPLVKFVRDRSFIFSISSLVRMLMTSFPAFLIIVWANSQFVYIIKIK